MGAPPVEDLLYSVKLKISRADQQREQLIATMHDWMQRNPMKMRLEMLPENKGFRALLGPIHQDSPANFLGLLFGEYVHNLRSALDNLAFALARLIADPPLKPQPIGFPISKDIAEFKKQSGKIDQLPAEAIGLITQLQPYNRFSPETVENDPLFMLREFSNMDKHRVPSIMLVVPKEFEIRCPIEFASDEAAAAEEAIGTWKGLGPLYEGMVLYEHITKHPIVKVDFHLNMQAACELFDGERYRSFDAAVTNMFNYVKVVVDLLTKSFPPKRAATE